jgi:hypothetical protein
VEENYTGCQHSTTIVLLNCLTQFVSVSQYVYNGIPVPLCMNPDNIIPILSQKTVPISFLVGRQVCLFNCWSVW